MHKRIRIFASDEWEDLETNVNIFITNTVARLIDIKFLIDDGIFHAIVIYAPE